MKQEISPKETSRAQAFELWMSSPMPMVTLVKMLDVTRLRKYAKRHSMPFNMALCWCIGKVANQIEEFFTIPEHGKLYRYDRLAINVIVSFQFHHVQMDGSHAARFLEELQKTINTLK